MLTEFEILKYQIIEHDIILQLYKTSYQQLRRHN